MGLGVKELGSASIGVPDVPEEESAGAPRSALWHEPSVGKGQRGRRFPPGSCMNLLWKSKCSVD